MSQNLRSLEKIARSLNEGKREPVDKLDTDLTQDDRAKEEMQLSSFMISHYWPEIEKGIDDASLGLKHRASIPDICDSINRKVEARVKESDAHLVDEVVLKVINRFSLVRDGRPAKYILDGMIQGAASVLSMAETVSNAFRKQFSGELGEDEIKIQLEGVLKGKAFQNLIKAMGYGRGVSMGSVVKGVSFDEGKIKFEKDNDEIKLSVDVETEENIRRINSEEKAKKPENPLVFGCPSGFAKMADKGTVMSKFSGKITDLYCQTRVKQTEEERDGELAPQIQNFAKSAEKVADYINEQKIKHVIVAGLSATLAKDMVMNIAERKNMPSPDYNLVNPHNIVYAVGYNMGIPFKKIHEGGDAWRDFSEYQGKVDEALRKMDEEDLRNRLEPIKALFEKEFPTLVAAIKNKEKVLILDEITATGRTLRTMVNFMKILYPNIDLKSGAIWRDLKPAYENYNIQCDIVGGNGLDLFESAEMGSYWTGFVDTKLSDGSPALAYRDDEKIVQDVFKNKGEINLSGIPLEKEFSRGKTVVGLPIKDILARRERAKKIITKAAADIVISAGIKKIHAE